MIIFQQKFNILTNYYKLGIFISSVLRSVKLRHRRLEVRAQDNRVRNYLRHDALSWGLILTKMQREKICLRKLKESRYSTTTRGEIHTTQFWLSSQPNPTLSFISSVHSRKQSKFASFSLKILIILSSCLAVSLRFPNLCHRGAKPGCSFPNVNWQCVTALWIQSCP